MIINVTPDKERVKSLLKITKNRKEFVFSYNAKLYTNIIVENYYEIIKELITAITLLDGFKTVGENANKELIDLLPKYKEFEEWELILIDDLRIKRNKSAYEGKEIDISYLENKKEKILIIIKKLENLLVKRGYK